MANWGDDYSLLIHSIEGHLSEHISASPLPDHQSTSSGSKQSLSAQKRQRLSTGTISSLIPTDEDDDFYSSRSISYQNADIRKMTAKMDETYLLNERLKDKLKESIDELAKHKEKSAKQLLFMESENSQLKKNSAGLSDRYYDEKQKWQSSLRAAEGEIAKLSRRGLLRASFFQNHSRSNLKHDFL